MKEIIARPSVTRKILNKYDLNLIKKMGQNMLIDPNILDIIIDAVDLQTGDLVIEIGPGIGSLTQKLLANLKSGRLIAVEKDTRMVEVLNDIFAGCDNLDVVNKDVLDMDWESYLSPIISDYNSVKVAANLPYYITTPIIMELLESNFFFSRLVFMVQKEVAARMAASPGTKDYGSLSVAVQYHGEAEIVHQVSPNAFLPRPEVHSSIVVLNAYEQNPYSVENEKFFFRVVKAIFQQRRKNIKNSLLKASVFDNLKKEVILAALDDCGLDSRIRGETLSIKKMITFSNSLWRLYRKDVI
ncbi:MAG: 16S rRNA (adenine(1518)-N(6)/adenine(1519)-N(6))-dimethyltransferase RsmA [Bacillota bacterium]